MSNSTEIDMLKMLIAEDGTAKKINATKIFPSVRDVKEKSKNPDPLELKYGGLTKIDTSNSTHHKNVMTRNKISNHLRARTLQRLYGDTAGSSGLRYPGALSSLTINLVRSFASSDVRAGLADDEPGLSTTTSFSSSPSCLLPHNDTIFFYRSSLSLISTLMLSSDTRRTTCD